MKKFTIKTLRGTPITIEVEGAIDEKQIDRAKTSFKEGATRLKAVVGKIAEKVCAAIDQQVTRMEGTKNHAK